MEPRMDFNDSSRNFSATMRQYLQISRRVPKDEINRRAKNVCLKSIRYTEKADKKEIKSALTTNGLAYKLVKKTGLNRKQIKAKVAKFIRARMSSASYIKAGWYKAAVVFGGRGGKLKPGKRADQGTGEKATDSKLTATMTNMAVGATKISGPALAKAMNEEGADMLKYIQRKLAEGWTNSGR
jgi:hypothetical protein